MKRIIPILLSFIVALCPLAPFVSAKEYTDVATEYEGTSAYATREEAVSCFVNAIGADKFSVDTGVLNRYIDKDKISYPYIDEMALAVSSGLISGYEDNSLRPRENITRAEALVILNRALGGTELSSWYDIKFSDTPAWAEDQINRLSAAGIVKGYGDGTLGARDYLTIIQVNTLCDRIERAIGPMGDYYTYVNSKWLEEKQLPEGREVVSAMNSLSETVNARIEDIIYDIYKRHYIDGGRYQRGTDQEKIANVYLAALDEGHREKIGLSPIKPLLEMIDKSNSQAEILKTMAELERNGFATLIDVSLEPNITGDKDYLPAISGCYTGLDAERMENGYAVEKYERYIKRLFEISGEENSESLAKQATEICKAMASGTKKQEGLIDFSTYASVYFEKDLVALYGGIDLKKYFSDIGILDVNKILVYDVSHGRKVASVLKPENKEAVKAYLKASVLDNSAMYLNKDMFEARQDFYNELYKSNDNFIPSDFATDQVQEILSWELGDLYVDRYFSENSKEVIEQMIKDIVNEYKELIDSSERMTRTGKNSAIKKLENIKVYSVYPEDIDRYKKDVHLRPVSEGGNIMEYRMLYANSSVKDCNDILSGKEKTEWRFYPQMVNAVYDYASNSITIPAGILQAPIFETAASYEENLGGIGTIIAHEISHAFDATGAQFDENGKVNSWWTEQDKHSFDMMCRKVAEEYSKVKYVGFSVDGNRTLNENISDIAGISCIISLMGEDNPRLGDMFESYARIWRQQTTYDYDRAMMTDNHSPNKVRVNRVLSNFEAFEDFYKIEEGDGMYIPDENKIDIWK